MISHYRELLFWKTAYEVTISVILLCRKLPKERVADILSSQIIRSAASVGANIAEGFGRYRGKEYQRFLQVSLGSANETDYWLAILKETYPNFSREIDIIAQRNMETIRMLAKSLQTLRSKK